jgi:hypothetical protein
VNVGSSSAWVRVSTASERLRFEMNGNGCAGSNDSGVSVGSTDVSKYDRISSRSSAVSSSYSRRWMPASASAGRTVSW